MASALTTPSLAGITLFSTGFEDYDNSFGDLNHHPGWTGMGSGTNSIGGNPTNARTGTRYVNASPPTDTTCTDVRPTLIAGDDLLNNPVVKSSLGMRMASSTSSLYGSVFMTMADSSAHMIADQGIYYDVTNTLGFGTRHLFVFFDWFDSTAGVTGTRALHDLGSVSSTSITTFNFGGVNKYLDASIALNFETGEIIFRNSLFGEESTRGQMAVGSAPHAFTDVQDVGFGFHSSAFMLVDDFNYQAFPEPASALVVVAAAMLCRRPCPRATRICLTNR